MPSSENRGLNAPAKIIDPGQTAQSAESDLGPNLSPLVNHLDDDLTIQSTVMTCDDLLDITHNDDALSPLLPGHGLIIIKRRLGSVFTNHSGNHSLSCSQDFSIFRGI